MRKLGLIALAASAAWVSAANAQTVPDPDLSHGAPDLRLALPVAAAAASSAAAMASASSATAAPAIVPMMSRGAAQMGHRGPQMRHSAPQMRHSMPQMRHSMPKMRHSMPQMRHQGPKFQGPKMGHQGPKYHGSKMGHRPPKMRHDFKMGHYGKGGKHFSKNFRHHRIDRGGSVSSFWWGPQYHVQNWGFYGFPEPGYDRRWVRYYDDALLIDRDGRVHDGRYGWDWDRYGERWDYDDRGVPGYAYDDDYRDYDDYGADERDHDWAEKDEERGDRRDRREDHAYGPPPPECSAPCTRVYHGPPPPHFYRHGYGYGYGYGGTVTETITTTTTAPVVETRTYYVKKAKPRHHVRKPVRRAPPPPKPGERG